MSSERLDPLIPTPSSASSSKRPRPTDEDSEDTSSRSSELARLRTVNFLSRLHKEGIVRETRTVENERIKESCYFTARQSLQEKRAKREPDCLAICYIQLKQAALEAQTQAAKAAEDVALPYWKKHNPPKQESADVKYRFRALEGKYIYKARGRMAIAKHAEEDITPEAVLELEEHQVKNPPRVLSRAEKMGIMSRAPLLPPSNYEILYPLCSGVSTRLARFEAHLIRIYSPTYNALQRIPSMYADGSARRVVEQLYERTISGDGLVLGQRLVVTGWEMAKKWVNGPDRGNGNGVPPTGPPPPPVLPPVAAPPPPA